MKNIAFKEEHGEKKLIPKGHPCGGLKFEKETSAKDLNSKPIQQLHHMLLSKGFTRYSHVALNKIATIHFSGDSNIEFNLIPKALLSSENNNLLELNKVHV